MANREVTGQFVGGWGARRRVGRRVLVAYACLVVGIIILPLLVVIPLSFTSSQFFTFPPPGWSLQWYRSFFTDPEWIASSIQSLEIATLSMFLSTTIGTLAAFPLVRREFRGRQALFVFIASPLIVPEITIAIGMYFVALPLGITDRLLTVALGLSVLTVPFATLIVAAGLRDFDRSLEDAAMSLGANRVRVLRYVTLPGIQPAIVTAMAFTFIYAFNDLLIPLYLASVRLLPLPVRIWAEVRSSLDLTTLSIAVLWFVMAVLVLIVVQLQQRRVARVRRGG